jgi:inhibitor of KinA sporulation pathway (predicted exonuclease)
MNDLRDQYYFALDLELNNKNDGTIPRIIEVGIAIGSPIRSEEIVQYNWYLNPEEPITPFITKLTGIDDATIEAYSVTHEVVAEELGALINTYECFTNPITWGQGDAEELKTEFRERNINFPFFGRRIFDVKTIYVFNQMVRGRSVSGGLRSAMGIYGLKFDGEPHRASEDAKNTLRFFFHLLNSERRVQEAIEQLTK